MDEICILRNGTVVACDRPEVLREKTSLPVKVLFTFKEDPETMSVFREKLRSRFPSQTIGHDVSSIQIEVGPDQIVDLMKTAFFNEHQTFESMRVSEPELEDVYEHLLENIIMGKVARALVWHEFLER